MPYKLFYFYPLLTGDKGFERYGRDYIPIVLVHVIVVAKMYESNKSHMDTLDASWVGCQIHQQAS